LSKACCGGGSFFERKEESMRAHPFERKLKQVEPLYSRAFDPWEQRDVEIELFFKIDYCHKSGIYSVELDRMNTYGVNFQMPQSDEEWQEIKCELNAWAKEEYLKEKTSLIDMEIKSMKERELEKVVGE
jgi:hypothetical protein